MRRRAAADESEQPPSDPDERRRWIAAHPTYDWYADIARNNPDLPWPAPGEPWPYA
jgi:hypothetical protein